MAPACIYCQRALWRAREAGNYECAVFRGPRFLPFGHPPALPALEAISLRCFAVRASARARPPSRPRAFA